MSGRQDPIVNAARMAWTRHFDVVTEMQERIG